MENTSLSTNSNGANHKYLSPSVPVIAFAISTESSPSTPPPIDSKQNEDEAIEEENVSTFTPLPTAKTTNDTYSPYDEQENSSEDSNADKDASSSYDEQVEPSETRSVENEVSSPYDEQEDSSEASSTEKEASSPYDEAEEDSSPTLSSTASLPKKRKKKTRFHNQSSRSRFKYVNEYISSFSFTHSRKYRVVNVMMDTSIPVVPLPPQHDNSSYLLILFTTADMARVVFSPLINTQNYYGYKIMSWLRMMALFQRTFHFKAIVFSRSRAIIKAARENNIEVIRSFPCTFSSGLIVGSTRMGCRM